MITILWEDSRQRARPRVYGPHQLVAACVADDLGGGFEGVNERFVSAPLNGNGNVRARLKRDSGALGISPVCAVFDRDRVRDLWPGASDCKSGICAAVRREIPGAYGLVLLHQNMETLVGVACGVIGRKTPPKLPAERDDVLARLTFGRTRDDRAKVRARVDGFDRLVRWVVAALGE